MERIKSVFAGRYFWFIAIAVFIVSRIPSWLYPFNSDHWIFYTVGKLWSQGATLYIDVWDHKSPVIYGYNALLHTLFGDSIVLHRLLFTAVALATAFCFYAVAKLLLQTLRAKNTELIARLSTLVFIFMANLGPFATSGNTTENIGVLLLCVCLWAYLLYRNNPMLQGYLLTSGAFAGMLVFLKANFVILLLPILFDLYILHSAQWRKLVANYAIFLVAPLAMALTWASYFSNTGAFKAFIAASLTFNAQYIKALGWNFSATGTWLYFGITVLVALLFAPFVLRALREFWLPPRELPFFVPLMALSALLFTLLLGTFFPYYYLIILPYLCLVLAATTTASFKRNKAPKVLYICGILGLLLCISYGQLIRGTLSDEANRDNANRHAAADYIAAKTNENEKVFTNMYGATLYQLAKRDPATRFVNAQAPMLDAKYAFGYDFTTTLIVDLEVSEARYVVMSEENDEYRTANPAFMRYLEKNYTLEATVATYQMWRHK